MAMQGWMGWRASKCILCLIQSKVYPENVGNALRVTTADQQAFMPVLEALRSEIERQLSDRTPSDDSIRPDNAIGRLTRMEAIQAQSISAAGKARLRKRLPQIERALKAIEEGTYGTCTSCGSDIQRGRLEIRPESRRCVACARR